MLPVASKTTARDERTAPNTARHASANLRCRREPIGDAIGCAAFQDVEQNHSCPVSQRVQEQSELWRVPQQVNGAPRLGERADRSALFRLPHTRSICRRARPSGLDIPHGRGVSRNLRPTRHKAREANSSLVGVFATPIGSYGALPRGDEGATGSRKIVLNLLANHGRLT